MTADDEKKMRQMLTDVLSGHIEAIHGRLNVVHANLVRIEENTGRIETQTVKTNGRVTQLERDVVQMKMDETKHTSNCPNNPRIKILEDNDLSRKAIAKFLLVATTLAGIIGGLAFKLIDLIFS